MKVNFLVVFEMEQDFSLESFFIIKYIFVMKNLADFHKTVWICACLECQHLL